MLLELAAVLQVASECAPSVAPKTIAAIVTVESGLNPYAIGVNTGTPVEKQPTTERQAVAMAKALLARGANIDLGLAQINSKNLHWLRLSVEEAFDPCSNLRAAATVLETGFRSSKGKGSDGQAALQMALSAYNTGNHSRGFENGYVQKVLNSAAHVVPDIEGTELLTPATIVRVKASKERSEEPLPQRLPSLDIFKSDQAARVNLFD